MTHICPRCKTTSRAIASNQGFMTVGGKSIVAVGDTSTCGARFIKISDLAVMDSGANSRTNPSIFSLIPNLKNNNEEKKVNKLYWSYGDKFIPLKNKSRFFDDLNLHIETTGYQTGEKINIDINPEPNEFNSFEEFSISLTIDNEGKGNDSKPYLLRVREMITFVEQNLGKADITFKPQNNQDISSQLSGKKGIIIFKVSGWGDASGHATLWNGDDCGDSCYFIHNNPNVRTTDILFWNLR